MSSEQSRAARLLCPQSHTVDARRVAAGLGVVSVDIGHRWIAEQLLDGILGLASLYERRLEQHVVGAKRPERQGSPPYHFWNLIHEGARRLGAFTHEDRMARAIRGIGGLVGVVHQQCGFAGLEIPQLDAIGRHDQVRIDLMNQERADGGVYDGAVRLEGEKRIAGLPDWTRYIIGG